MPYDVVSVCASLGVHVKTLILAQTWGAWVPQYHAIVLAADLTPAQRISTLAHHIEHAIGGHGPCGTGPFATALVGSGFARGVTLHQDFVADRAAARKLLAGVDLSAAAGQDTLTWAHRLGVTEHMLAVRLQELEEGAWPATSRTAG